MIDKFLKNKSSIYPKQRLPFEKSGEELLRDWASKTIDAFFVHSQVPVVGSVLYCNLALALEHTGIYVGDNQVVHLNGDGTIEKVSFNEFMARLNGNNITFSVFCAVNYASKSIGGNTIADRALSMVGKRRNYNIALDNCHRFTSYCLTGKDYMCTTFTGLEEILKKKYGFHSWKAINLD